jgi:hypothetical protein
VVLKGEGAVVLKGEGAVVLKGEDDILRKIKPCPNAIFPPQISHGLAGYTTSASESIYS